MKTYRGEGPAYVHELFTLAQSMICHYGMDESIGMSSVDLQTVDSAYYAKIQERVNEILAEQLAEAKAIILKKSRDG